MCALVTSDSNGVPGTRLTEVFRRKKFQEFFRLEEVLMSMGRCMPALGLGTGGGNRPAASATGSPACVEVTRGKGFSQGDLHGKAGRASRRYCVRRNSLNFVVFLTKPSSISGRHVGKLAKIRENPEWSACLFPIRP